MRWSVEFISPLQGSRINLVIDPQGVALRALPWAITFHAFSVKNTRADQRRRTHFLTTVIFTSDGYCFE